MKMKTTSNKTSKNVRKIKVIRQNANGYKPTPTIILKGQWLEKFGFGIDTPVTVTCRNGKLVITRRKIKVYSSPMDILVPGVADDPVQYGR